MSRPLRLSPDRLFSSDPDQRAIAHALYAEIATLPIVSPHGHTDPRWFATDEPWRDATSLLLAPDHYLFRMLYSQGIDLARLGVRRATARPIPTRARRGARSPITITCSAARRRECGSTTSSPTYSA